jgi:hypothetical protein
LVLRGCRASRGELNEMRNGAFYLKVIINTFAADDKRPALIVCPFRNRCAQVNPQRYLNSHFCATTILSGDPRVSTSVFHLPIYR